MKTSLKFDHKQIKTGEEASLYLLVKVTGPKGDNKRERLPLNLSVVIDRSGSMSGKKLQYVKMAAQELVRGLSPRDHLSLVSYGHDVRIELEPRRVENRSQFRRAIDGIQIQGNTFLSGGWQAGCELVSANLQERGLNRTLLLTDGLANVGITDPNQLAAMARRERERGVTTTTFGVGMGYNEDLLSRMANEGGGAFYFIDNPDQAEALFKEELKDLYNVVGQHLVVALETEPEVRSVKQLYEYPRSEVRGALAYRLGDLYAEEDRYQLFELKLRALEEGEVKLGRVRISYDQIQEGEVKVVKRSRQIKVQVVSPEEFKEKSPNPEVEKAVLVQRVRMARREALALADQRDFTKAEKVLHEMAKAIQASGTEDEELLDLYDQLLEEARDMEFGAQRYDAYSRKSQTYKVASAARFDRNIAMQDDLHIRHNLSKASIERQGKPPRVIRWRGGQMELVGREIKIGLARDNDIVLQQALVEEYHCRLLNQAGEWFLEDRSQGGTIANAGRVSDRFRLSKGDVIRIGKVLLELE